MTISEGGCSGSNTGFSVNNSTEYLLLFFFINVFKRFLNVRVHICFLLS